MGKVTQLPKPDASEIEPPRPILASDDISKFFCKHESLDDWLKNRALKSEGRSARTYVVCKGGIVVGYYCIATGAVRNSEAPGKVKRNSPDPIPIMILGRLAVDKHFEGQRIGSGMLKDALQRIVQVSDAVGCRAVLVHAIDDDARTFYEKYGFIEFPTGTKTMYLPLEHVAATLA